METKKAKSIKVGSVLMSQEDLSKNKVSKPYIKIENDVTLKKGDYISIVPPSRSKKNATTGEYEALEVPGWVKNDLVYYIKE